jgi:DNA-binding response OmpR family regulator
MSTPSLRARPFRHGRVIFAMILRSICGLIYSGRQPRGASPRSLKLDRDLPGIHGDTLCQTIIAADEPAMILMLTAAGTPDDRVAGLALGADDYLPKPFHFPELVLRVRSLARRKSTAQRRTLDVAGIELDPLTGSVTRDGEAIDLTTKERAVLEALLTASPHPLSAEKLLQQAWDENTDPFTNAVRVTIARLRRKLGEPQVIHTTPGIGYRIPCR